MEPIQIKICGITSIQDAQLLNMHQVQYAGFVLFYPKSKRNLELREAKLVMDALDNTIKRVAVVVSPTSLQITQIVEAGFDIVQIHGELSEEVRNKITIPIFRAFHIDQRNSIFEREQLDSIEGFVLDGKVPGSGNVFDWELTKQFNRGMKKLMLAGGLNSENVMEGILQVQPDIVDVSTGVEKDSGIGKDPDKVREFVTTVRAYFK